MIPISDIFSIESEEQFERVALEIFRFQASHCEIYRRWLEALDFALGQVSDISQIPFLPVEMFKSHRVYCGQGDPEQIFTSSATTGMIPASHYVADLSVYRESFMRGFELFYGSVEKMGVYALLPSYLEREGSSLIYMFDHIIKAAAAGGFYLYDTDRLIEDMNSFDGPKLLIGVSYALLDLAEKGVRLPSDTIVMETGGMKGRREELSKSQLHDRLSSGLGVDLIHSEYGMAELLSQAYSSGKGAFFAPPWMRVRVRDLNDPFREVGRGRIGGIDIIDLANIYSCSFISTRDMGEMYDDGSFMLAGRIKGSDVRGCNLLVDGLL